MAFFVWDRHTEVEFLSDTTTLFLFLKKIHTFCFIFNFGVGEDTLSSAQVLFLALLSKITIGEFWGTYVLMEIKLGSPTCKANPLPTVLWPLYNSGVLWG